MRGVEHHTWFVSFGLWVAVLVFLPLAFGDTFSISCTGTFAAENALQPFAFTLLTPSLVTIESWGFAGGINGQGAVIPAGGFTTVLLLFDSAGMEVGNLAQGGFPHRTSSPAGAMMTLTTSAPAAPGAEGFITAFSCQ